MKAITTKSKLVLQKPENPINSSPAELPPLNAFDQDDIVAELLENQLRRRAQTRLGTLPQWSYW